MEQEIVDVLSNWDASECAAPVEKIAARIMDIIRNTVTDATPRDEYKDTCLYCGRPAHEPCG